MPQRFPVARAPHRPPSRATSASHASASTSMDEVFGRSNVLNDAQDQRISPETQARVREVARRLGYAPDPAARALRNGKTDIALIANPLWILGPLVAAGLTAAVEHLESRGYAPLLAIGRAAASENLVGACQRVHPRGLIAPAAELTPRTLRLIRASDTLSSPSAAAATSTCRP